MHSFITCLSGLYLHPQRRGCVPLAITTHDCFRLACAASCSRVCCWSVICQQSESTAHMHAEYIYIYIHVYIYTHTYILHVFISPVVWCAITHTCDGPMYRTQKTVEWLHAMASPGGPAHSVARLHRDCVGRHHRQPVVRHLQPHEHARACTRHQHHEQGSRSAPCAREAVRAAHGRTLALNTSCMHVCTCVCVFVSA